MRYERDEDFEVAEPAAAADEDSNAERPQDRASVPAETATAYKADFHHDVIVAEVIDAEPGHLPADEDEDEPGDPIAAQAVAPEAGPATSGHALAPAATGTADMPLPGGYGTGPSFASHEWREIQATFVDDPHGAVQMAATAADTALTALVTGLRERHASLDPTATQDTEQLRAALQQYRRFCQAISEVGRQLPQSAAAVR